MVDNVIKVGAWHYTDFCNIDNNLFTNTEVGIGDDALLGTVMLYQKARANNITIEIADLSNIGQYDVLICFDIFWKNKSLIKKFIRKHNKAYKLLKNFSGRRFLVLHECATVHDQNWNVENHKIFDKIFTWSDDHIDQIKYFKLNCAPRAENKTFIIPQSDKKRLVSMICSNIINTHRNELYSKRKEIIDYACQNYWQNFDLYGKGWDLYKFNQKKTTGRLLNKLSPFLRKVGIENKSYKKVYRGILKQKMSGIQDYQFHFCLENAFGYPGYVTEKLFDAMLFGSIPIYKGAPNVKNIIPENCIIDIDNFKDLRSLFLYISNMSLSERQSYQDNIIEFLSSQNYRPFTLSYYVNTLLDHIRS